MAEYLTLEELELGGVYQLMSRNLLMGVYDGSGGFIGIREKFWFNSLFKEFHWETSRYTGTVRPIRKVAQLPDGIEIVEHLGWQTPGFRRNTALFDFLAGREKDFVCAKCGGSGRLHRDGKFEPCGVCDGSGFRIIEELND